MSVRRVLVSASVLMGACAHAPPVGTDYAQVDVSTTAQCDKGSAVIRDLRSIEGHAIRGKSPPYRVPAGVYSIGVSCGTILDEQAACIDTLAGESRTEVDPYELVLRPNRRYTFSCTLVRRQHVVRLSETAL